jgi:Periplasmic component of the Tol biopolymer transport system
MKSVGLYLVLLILSSILIVPVGAYWGEIAFSSKLDGDVDIYVINMDGSGLQRLTDNPGVDTDPDWSPDGMQIAFTSDRDGYHRIYTIDADGKSPPLQITTGIEDTQPDWSPDGDKIAYTSYLSNGRNIVVMDVDGVIPHRTLNNRN